MSALHVTIALVLVALRSEDCSLARSLSTTESVPNGICITPACRSAAVDLRRFMNLSVDPCQDFDEFVCGNFSRNAPIPPDKAAISSLDDIHDKLEYNLREILEKPVKYGAPKYETFLKNFYKSCTDTAAIEEQGVHSLLKFLDDLGGWPLIKKNWDEEQIDLTELLANLTILLDRGIFGSSVLIDESNSSAHLFSIYQIGLTFPKDYYNDTERKNMLEALKQIIVDVALQLSTNNATESILKEVEEFVNFEKRISEIIDTPEEIRHLTQEKICPDNLSKLFSKTIRFHDFIKSIFGKAGKKVCANLTVGVYSYSYFKKLSLLLEKTPKRNIVNYLMWLAVKDFLIVLPQKFENFMVTFMNVTKGTSEMEPRWKSCISLINHHLYLPLGALYVNAYFNSSAKVKANELIRELKQTFGSMILNVPWLLNETKTYAIEKLNNMRDFIGYPDYFDGEKPFDDMFEGVKVKPDTLLDGMTSAISTEKKENLKLLGKPVDENRPDVEIAVVNAYYSHHLNAIVFPAGILQWPFFSESIPMYMNFGGMAYVIGHEITHGFDDRGRKYDKKGNFFNWWKDDDQQKFEKASQCFVDEYNNFVVKDIDEHINGKLTLGENIADNGGLRASFMAYKHWTKINGNESPLVGLPFTPDQMFFISFARFHCSKIRPEAAANYIKKDVHAPGRYRTIGSLINMEEFSEAFKCTSGSPMNPIDKCRVW